VPATRAARAATSKCIREERKRTREGPFSFGAHAALAPATLVDARLARATDVRLRLAQAQGSLWSGAGWIEIRDAHGRAGVARRLAWRVLPGSLLRGRLVAEVDLDQAAKPFPVTISLSRIDIADAGRWKLFAFHAFVICAPANGAPAANGA
jgi:hypothetical protein